MYRVGVEKGKGRMCQANVGLEVTFFIKIEMIQKINK